MRAISTDVPLGLTKLGTDQDFIHSQPDLLGYARKDPFDHVLYFMTKVH